VSQPSSDKTHVGKGEKKRFLTTDLEAFLELAGRMQRDYVRQKEEPGSSKSPYLTPEQIQEWFSRERYVCAEEIAEGGMAKIYCGADLHLCRTVALKTLLAELTAENVSRFVYEAQITAQLQHPSIVPIYDVGLDLHTERPFFTMQLISGRSLLDIILGVRKGLPEFDRFENMTERLHLFLKACDAIAFAHSRLVVHQDIKPSNIMIGDYGEVYVIDWGIAQSKAHKRSPDPETGEIDFDTPRLSSFHDVYSLDDTTNRSIFMGSPVHMAPEQFVDPETVDVRSDIYCLGCTLYELVAMHTPFDGLMKVEELLALKKRNEFIPVTEHLPQIQPALARVIHKCMEAQKDDRFQSVADLQTAVVDCIHRGVGLGAPSAIGSLAEYVDNLDDDKLSPQCRYEILSQIAAIEMIYKPE